MTRPLNFEFYDPFSDSLAQWPHIEAIAERARRILGPLSLVELNSLAQEGVEALLFYETLTGTRGPAITAIHSHRSMNEKRFGSMSVGHETILAALSLMHIDRAVELIGKSKRVENPSKLAVEFSFLVSLAQDAVSQAENCEPNRQRVDLSRSVFQRRAHSQKGGIEKGKNFDEREKMSFALYDRELELQRNAIKEAARIIKERLFPNTPEHKLPPGEREIASWISDWRAARRYFDANPVLQHCDVTGAADQLAAHFSKTRRRKAPSVDRIDHWIRTWRARKMQNSR